MRDLLEDAAFRFIRSEHKNFIVAFDDEMNRLGYTSGGTIGNGYCRGRKMIIYTKAGVKSKKSYARLYLRENALILRMYFSNVDKQRRRSKRRPATFSTPLQAITDRAATVIT